MEWALFISASLSLFPVRQVPSVAMIKTKFFSSVGAREHKEEGTVGNGSPVQLRCFSGSPGITKEWMERKFLGGHPDVS
jgi:hypothetical protein